MIVSEKMGIVRAVSLNLNTPLGVPSCVGQWSPSCHSSETIKKSLYIPLLVSGTHDINLTSETLVFK